MDSVGFRNEHMKLGRKDGGGGVEQELEGREGGGYDQNTLHTCMKFSN